MDDLTPTPAILEEILLRATAAPSDYNLQPWRFLVVRDARNRQLASASAWNRPEVRRAPVVVIVLADRLPARAHLEPMLERAVAEGTCSPARAAEIRGRVVASMERSADPTRRAELSTMLAASRLILAAESMGVAATLIEEFDADALRRDFGIPDDHSICRLIALGHAPEPNPTPGRFGLNAVCFAEHFGQPFKA